MILSYLSSIFCNYLYNHFIIYLFIYRKHFGFLFIDH
nr:MAG TPA: hypothetical protein [Caudoviricetes sp.]